MKRSLALLLVVAMMAFCSVSVAETLRYDMVCGLAAEATNDVPVAAWVQLHPDTHEILNVYLTGSANPETADALAALDASEFVGVTAEEAADVSNADAAASAVKDACARYIQGAAFSIRPYQTMAVDRYLANNPHFDTLEADVTVDVSIIAAYPADCITLVTEDVLNNGNVTYPAGTSTTAFTYGENSYKVTHSVVIANKPGIAVIAYTYGDTVVLDAIDVFENFTLYPEVLSGSDAYGKVIASCETEDTITYIVLGDKAMNFPGGTAGSTLVSVTINKADSTIAEVVDMASSDSTYLSNAWEYGGGFANVGDALFAIDQFTALFTGRSANEAVARYELSSAKNGIVGGVVVEGGIDLVVTGATRTPNAIISAVNAAIEAFQADMAK